MSYSATVLADSPVAYWRLGEASGTSMGDSSGHSHTGTYGGSPTLGATGLLTSDSNTAVTFNGSTQYGQSDGSTAYNLGTLSIEAWFKTTAGAGINMSIADRDDEGSNRSWQFRLNSGKPEVIMFLGGNAFTATAASTKNDGARHHMVATYDGTTIRLYVDGTQVATSAVSFTVDSGGTTPVGIACHDVNNNGGFRSQFYSGTVDEVAIYSGALSSTRITAHYNAGIAAPTHLAATGGAGDLVGTAALTLVGAPTHLPSTGSAGDLVGSATLRLRTIRHLAATALGCDLVGSASLPAQVVHLYSATDDSNIAVVDVLGEAYLEALPPAPTVPTGKTLNMRKFACYTYTAPSVDTATGEMVKQTRTLASSGTWGYLQVVVARQDKTWVRGERTRIVGPMTWSIPGGPTVLTLRFPAIRPFEDLSTSLAISRDIDGAGISIYHRNADHSLDMAWSWQGNVHAKRPVMQGDEWYWEVDCVGFLQEPQQAVHQPPFAIYSTDEQDIGRRVAKTLNSWPQRDYTFIKPVDIGIPTLLRGSFGDSRLAFTRDLFAIAWTADGRQWRIADIPGPGRRSRIELPGTAADFHVSVGQDGVDLSNLVAEGDEAPNVIFGEWVDKDGNRSQNVKYPHMHEDTAPAYPLTDPAVFNPGDGHTGFQPFSDWLRNHGNGMIYSQDTYDARDEDDVKAAQTRMGVTVDGVVGRQTWGTAFNTGANVGDLNNAFYMPLAADTRTQPRLYTPDGQDLGPNPNYDANYPVREVKIDFGSGVTRAEVVKAARALLTRNTTGKNYAGTIKMTSDFEEGSRFSMAHGKILCVRHLDGSGSAGVLFHISDVSHDDPESDESPVTLTVDTKYRDAPTLTALLENRREARRDPARVLRRQETAKLTQSTRTPFDPDNSAGMIYKHAIQSGYWRVVQFPAAAYGTFVDLVATTSPAREFVLGLFVKPVTANFLAQQVGNPLAASNTRPFEPSRAVLREAGLIQAWGSGAQPGGYSDGYAGAKTAGDVLTGKIEDDASTTYASFRPPYLWLAEYCTGGNTDITVTFRNAPENV